MAWSKNGTTTLSSAGDTVTISDLTATEFNVFLSHVLNSSSINLDVTTDNNSNTDYAVRRSDNGAADGTDTSDTNMNIVGDGQQDAFIISYGVNIDGEEKLFISNAVRRGTAGAASAPNRRESVSKVDTTTNSGQYTRIDINNSQTGDYDAGSNLTALNGDTTETVTLQDGTIFEESDTNKAYIWNSSTTTWTQLQ